jgi:alpha-L-fucosidase 2
MTANHPNTLWLTTPAARWLDALPIGNGRLGAMVFGGMALERLALNHENLWRGCTRDRTVAPAAAHLPEIQQALLAGKWLEGAELAKQYLSGHDRRVEPYQPAGDLRISFPHSIWSNDYRRSLDLPTGVLSVDYSAFRFGKVHREYFASSVHGVIVTRLRTEEPGQLTFAAKFDRIPDPDCTVTTWAEGARFGLRGTFPEGVSFAIEGRLAVTGGTVTADADGTLRVQGADAALIVLTIATNYCDADPAAACATRLDAVPLDFAALKAAHVAEHQGIFDRVALDVPRNAEAEALPLDTRLKRLRDGGDDPGMGRSISSMGATC